MRRYDIKQFMRLGEEFIAARAGGVVVEAPRALALGGAPPTNVFVLLQLACDLRMTSVVDLCTEKLSELPNYRFSARLTNEWVDGASLAATRAVLKASKLCRS